MEMKDIYNLIKEFNKIVIHRHLLPDGDALGAQIGLKEAICQTFPDKIVKCAGEQKNRFFWMGSMDVVPNDFYENALVIIVDTGAEKLIDDTRYKNGKYILKIDHHIAQGEFGDESWVDTSFESCAGMITYFVKTMGMTESINGATALFTGIVTDSGRFRYPQTSSRTFDMVSWLMGHSIDINAIYTRLYTESLANVKLKAKLVNKFEVTKFGVGVLKNTKEDIKKYNLPINDISRGMVNIMSGIREIKVWVNFSEDINSNIYCEFRSNGADVFTIAKKYGGGGHLQASGATIHSWSEADCVIENLNILAREN